MPIIKIQRNLSGSSKGSSADSVKYLEKEQRFKDVSTRKNEAFFNQNSREISPEEVVKKLDSKRRGLGKKVDKYFSIIISPSDKELKFLTDEDLKNYTSLAMEEYAKNFNKNIDPSDLVWFAKLEHTRKYKGYKNGKNEKLPPGKKSGQFKPGDNRHIHVLVPRKSEKNVSLSPFTNARAGDTEFFNKGVKMGFSRVGFIQKAEDVLLKKLMKEHPNFKVQEMDVFAGRYLKSNNNDYEKAEKIGLSKKHIEKIKTFKKPSKSELTKDIRSEIFNINNMVLSQSPKDLEDYIAKMKENDVVIYKVIKNDKVLGLKVKYKNQHFKGSEVNREMSVNSINKIISEKSQSNKPLKIEININGKVYDFKGYSSNNSIVNVTDKETGEIKSLKNGSALKLILNKTPDLTKSDYKALQEGKRIALRGNSHPPISVGMVTGKLVYKSLSMNNLKIIKKEDKLDKIAETSKAYKNSEGYRYPAKSSSNSYEDFNAGEESNDVPSRKKKKKGRRF